MANNGESVTARHSTCRITAREVCIFKLNASARIRTDNCSLRWRTKSKGHHNYLCKVQEIVRARTAYADMTRQPQCYFAE